jgi:hypothetical protein
MTRENKMGVIELAGELLASGWHGRKMTILAARYYKGLETRETLLKYLTAEEVAFIMLAR